jgi:hypothetical protein
MFISSRTLKKSFSNCVVPVHTDPAAQLSENTQKANRVVTLKFSIVLTSRLLGLPALNRA